MSALPQEYAAPGSDELLARRAAHGDQDAFAELYRRYSGRLAAFGARIVGDRSAGEDVAQTSLLKAYQAMRRGRGPVAVRPWLYRIAQNVAYESLRRRRDVLGAEIEEGREDAHEARLDRETLLEAVRVLPQRQRDVYLLRELHGLPVREIAARLELAVPQVEQALFAARNRLAEALVFGGRLTCEQVRTLQSADLTRTEQRALKSHARWCGECRRRRPVRGLGLVATLESGVRQLLQVLAGGAGAPAAAAAKAGAVAAAAALAAGAPVVGVALERHHRAHVASNSAQRPAHEQASTRRSGRAADPVVAPWAAGAAGAPEFLPVFVRRAAPRLASTAPAAGPAARAPSAPSGHAPPAPSAAESDGLVPEAPGDDPQAPADPPVSHEPQHPSGVGTVAAAPEETALDEARPAEEQPPVEDQPVADEQPPGEEPSADEGEPSAEEAPAEPEPEAEANAVRLDTSDALPPDASAANP